MSSLERGARDFLPDMMVMAGFHMIEAKDAEFREKQILTAFSAYSSIVKDRVVPIHVEVTF